MPSQILVLQASAQNTISTSVFSLSAGDKIFLGRSSVSVTATLQRRKDDGSSDWADTVVSVTTSTTVSTPIVTDISPLLSSGYVYRFRLSATASVWVAIDPAVATGFQAGYPNITIPENIYNFTPLPYPPSGGSTLASLPVGSKVLMFKAGQSNWQGGGPDGYIGTLPQKTKYWNGSAWVFIRDGGYRSAACPSYYFANKFELQYPNLELLLVEGGEGGSGFYGNKWESGGALRASVLSSFTAATNAARAITTVPVYLWGMTWNQGEADADTVQHATDYITALPVFVTAVKSAVDPRLTFVPTRLNDSLVGYNQLNAIRLVHQSYTPLIDIDEVPMHTDNIHYTRAGYTQIGEKQYDVMNTVPLVQINTVSGGTTLKSFNFASISSIPTGFVLTACTPTYAAGHTELDRGATNNWSTSYMTSPALNWVGYDINAGFISRGLSAVGVSLDYSTGLFNGANESLAVVQSGAIFYKGNEVANLGVSWVTDTAYNLRFGRLSDTSIKITLFAGATQLATQTVTVTTALGSSTPKIIFDSAYINMRVVKVEETEKAAPPLDPVSIVMLSGQSNLTGEPYTTAYTGTVPTKTRYWDNVAGLFKPIVLLAPGTRPAEGAGFRGFHNPLTVMAARLEALYPTRTFYIIEQENPGNGFSSSSGNGVGSFAAGQLDRTTLMEKIDKAEAWLVANGQPYVYQAHILQQGENEALRTEGGTNYKNHLLSYHRDIRARTTPSLPCITNRLSINNTRFSNTATRDLVRAAHVDVAVATAFVNQDDLPMFADADTFVRHFTTAGYTTLGQRWADLPQLNPANGLASNNTSSYQAPTGVVRDYDFVAASTMPVGFTAVGTTPSFATGLNLTVANPQNWGNGKLIGPLWNKTRPLSIRFRGWVTTNGGVGVYDNTGPLDWSSIVGKAVVAIRQAAYYGSTNAGTYPAFVANTEYIAEFHKTATDLVVNVRVAATGAYHGLVIIPDANLADATSFIFVDCISTAMKIFRITN